MRTSIVWKAVFISMSLIPSSMARAEAPWIVRGLQGMVAADSKYASEAGVEILRAGGNAIDAAVATSFALAVTRPYSTGLGGGGFMVAHMANGRVIVQDFRECAPGTADAEMFVRARDKDPTGPSPSEFGPLAVAVPGLVAGRHQALVIYGTMTLDRVVKPAVRLANEGFPVDEDYVARSAEVGKDFEKYPALKSQANYVYHTFFRDGKLMAVGDTLRQPALGKLLDEIGRNGPDFFYRGPVAEAIDAEMRRSGGILNSEDLAGYKAKFRPAVEFDYRGFHVITMPSPSSGGIALAESLNTLDNFDLPKLAKSDPALPVHYQIEAMKHAFADRAQWLGDKDFVSVPIERLLSQVYADSLARQIEPDKVGSPKTYGSLGQPKDAGTSHFCVVDRWGNVVVSTETINTEFGSLMAIDEWGLVLNNEMDDFTAEPGKPNAFGLIQSSANAVAAYKRPISSMTPTIVLKDGKPYLMLGASGGPRIISAVLNVILGVLDFGLSLETAIERSRPHHQWQPDKVFFDRDPPKEIVEGLKRRGHEIANERRGAVVQAIMKMSDGWIGASDPRKGGIPAGY